MLRRLVAPVLVATVLLTVPAAAAAATSIKPFGNPCTAQNGVRFCPATKLSQRVPSFDGVPIDVDVTLPAKGKGPWPTIALLHGYGGNKTATESKTKSTGFNNVGLAGRGYAVLSISARGFGNSCGLTPSRVGKGCKQGWLHLADQRYEVRDTQVLLGKLVDQGIAKANALGASGGSYGGGQSLQLAFLKNQIRLPNGTFAAWKSPKGTKLSLAAAYPVVPWSDLASALVPNGRASDFADPPGVPIQSYVNGLYVAGAATGQLSPPGKDPQADLTTWRNLLNAGEPYGAQAQAALKQLSEYHSVTSLMSRTPAPLLLASGWTDDLFPPVQTLRVYDALRAKNPNAPVWLQYGDLGHPRGGAHATDQATIEAEAEAFFATYLQKKKSTLPAPGSVLAFGQTCPSNAPDGLGPFRAASYSALVGTQVTRLTLGPSGQPETQTVTSTGGDPALAKSLSPVGGLGANGCSTYPAKIDPGTAVVQAPAALPTTYLGMGHITATIDTSGPYGQLDARLWDVSGDQQTLVDRSVYRLTPNQTGQIAFDLHGNGYRFEPGHTIKLELVGNDSPTHRASNGTFSVTVSNLAVDLPTQP